DVAAPHEGVSGVGPSGVGRPDVHGAGRQASGDGEVEGLRGTGVDRLDDGAVVAVVRRLERDVAAVAAVAADVAARTVEVVPAGGGELGCLGHHPGVL